MNDDTIIVDLSSMDLRPYTWEDGTTVSLDIGSASASDITIDDWIETSRIVDEYHEELAIRERNAGVQAAWEQYKIMVELAKNPPDILDNN
jgi:hypothetical protein